MLNTFETTARPSRNPDTPYPRWPTLKQSGNGPDEIAAENSPATQFRCFNSSERRLFSLVPAGFRPYLAACLRFPLADALERRWL